MRSEKLRKRLYRSLVGAAKGVYVGLRESFCFLFGFVFLTWERIGQT